MNEYNVIYVMKLPVILHTDGILPTLPSPFGLANLEYVNVLDSAV
jgi:hypothetical protein